MTAKIRKTDSENVRLAKSLYNAYENADPFGMPEYGLVAIDIQKQLKTVNGCHDLIEELLNLIEELNK